jgi:hypothetical protein
MLSRADLRRSFFRWPWTLVAVVEIACLVIPGARGDWTLLISLVAVTGAVWGFHAHTKIANRLQEIEENSKARGLWFGHPQVTKSEAVDLELLGFEPKKIIEDT